VGITGSKHHEAKKKKRVTSSPEWHRPKEKKTTWCPSLHLGEKRVVAHFFDQGGKKLIGQKKGGEGGGGQHRVHSFAIDEKRERAAVVQFSQKRRAYSIVRERGRTDGGKKAFRPANVQKTSLPCVLEKGF